MLNSVCVCVCVCMFVWVHVCAHVCMCACCACMCVCVCVCVHVRVCVCACYACMCVSVCVHVMRACVCVQALFFLKTFKMSSFLALVFRSVFAGGGTHSAYECFEVLVSVHITLHEHLRFVAACFCSLCP